MRIDLSDFYFGSIIALTGLFVIIYFTFILKFPQKEKESHYKKILKVYDFSEKIIFKLLIIYTIIALFGFLIRSISDIPHILNAEPRIAKIEAITGIYSNSRSNSLFVRDLTTGDVFEIRTRQRPVNTGEIYFIEYLPNTGWAYLELIYPWNFQQTME